MDSELLFISSNQTRNVKSLSAVGNRYSVILIYSNKKNWWTSISFHRPWKAVAVSASPFIPLMLHTMAVCLWSVDPERSARSRPCSAEVITWAVMQLKDQV